MNRLAGLLLVGSLAVGCTGSDDEAGRSEEGGPTISTQAGQYERVAVQWGNIGVSPDGRTITVSSYYPIGSDFCVKKPDGVEVRVQGPVAIVTVWMRGPDLPNSEGTSCTDECASVKQSVTLPTPLPDTVTTFEAPTDAQPGCGGESERRTPRRPDHA